MAIKKDWYIELLFKFGLWKHGKHYKGPGFQHEPNDSYRLHGLLAKRTVWAHCSYCALVLATVWCLVGFGLDLIFPGDNWFQRSGSVLVAASVVAGYFGFFDSPVGSTPNLQFFEITHRFNNVRMFSRKLAFTIGVVGTFIWGYGDMMVPEQCSGLCCTDVGCIID